MGTLHFSLDLWTVWSAPSHFILFILNFYPAQYTSVSKYWYNAVYPAIDIKPATTNSKMNIQPGKMQMKDEFQHILWIGSYRNENLAWITKITEFK